MDVRLLGPVQVVAGDEVVELGSSRPALVLVALATATGHRLPTDELVDRVFGDDQPDDPVPALRTAVRRLRRAIGDDTITTHRGAYELDLTNTTLDIDRFAELIAAGRATNDPVAAQTHFHRALDLWRGTPFGDLGELDWLTPERIRLEELHLVALEGWHDAHLRNGSATEIIPSLEAAAAEHPLRERFHRQLMHALYLADRQPEALRVFQALREELIDAGLEPSAETVEMEQRIAVGDPSLRVSSGTRALRGYEIEERLGEGAFSIVYRGRQPSVDRPVAIKQIRAELANRPEFIRRFETEAHLVARLEHPHIVPLYDYWREPGSAYLVMRYLRGGNLESRIFDGRWDLDQTLAMVHQVGDALATAHRAGVVHRDVKPANILLDEDDNAYLADFGIALEAAEAADPAAALSAGSPAYASPEQLQRLPVGPPADVHGLAIATYEALTGRLPFPDEPDKASMLQRQLHDPIPPVRDTRTDIPTDVDAVLAKATAKSPVDRYQSVEEFVTALEAAAAGGTLAGAVVGGSRRTMVAAEERNPYKGLRAFDEADAGDFAGRERLVDQLVESLIETRLVAVVGPSGSGKSSVVRAGLLPAVRSGRVPGSAQWFITTLVPGARPFEELETALLRIAAQRPADLLTVLKDGDRGIARGVRHALPETDDQVLLVIDQFEELFTLAEPAETIAFLDALAVAVTESRSRLRVVLTLRADFYDRPLRHDSIGRLVRDATVAVLPLAPDELEHAIVDPAHSVGAEFEPGLVAEIAVDVADQPGALPLLQYALTELYELRQSGLMTREAYRKLGGVAGALGRRAEELYDAASTEEQTAVRRIFGRLVSLGEGTEDTRRRALRSELGDDAATTAVIDRYGEARLLSFDRDPASREPTVEVAHEALLREWPRLGEWLDEDRDGLRILRHLHTTASEWDAAGRPDAELYRGGRLEAAEELAASSPEDLRPIEREFVDAGVARRQAEAEAERRTNQRLRRLLVGVGVVAVVALVAGLIALQQRGRAQDNEELAEERAEEALAREEQALAAESQAVAAQESERVARSESETRRMIADAARLAETDPQLALLLAAEAHNREPGDDSLGGLQRTMTHTGNFLGVVSTDPDFDTIQFDRDGALLASGDAGVWRFGRDGSQERLSDLPPGERSLLAPDAGVIVHIEGNRSSVYALDGGELRFELEHRGEPVNLATAGSTLAANFEGGWVETWDLSTGQRLAEIHALPEATWGEVNESIDPELRNTRFDWFPITAPATPVALSADGTTVAVGGAWLVRFFSTDDGSSTGPDLVLRYELDGVPETTVATESLGFFDEDRKLFGASPFFTYVYDLDTQENLDVRASGLLDENPMIASSAGVQVKLSGRVSFLRTVGDFAVGTAFQSTQGVPQALAVAPDETRLAIGSSDGIAIYSLVGAGVLNNAVPRRGARSLSILPTGDRIVTDPLFGSTVAHIYDRDAGTDRWSASRYDLGGLGTVYVFNDQRRFDRDYVIIGVGLSGMNTYADPETLEPYFEIERGGAPAGARISERLLALGADDALRILDLEAGEIVQELEPPVPNPSDVTTNTFLVLRYSAELDRLTALFWNGDIGSWSPSTWDFDMQRTATDMTTLAYHPDGKIAVSGAADGTLQIRDAATLEPVGDPLLGHQSEIGIFDKSIYFLGDDLMVTLGQDQTLRLWNLETRQQIGDALVSADELGYDVQPLSDLVATATENHFLLWNYDVDAWPEIACQAAGRNLTLEEWEQFGPAGEPYCATCPQWPSAEDL